MDMQEDYDEQVHEIDEMSGKVREEVEIIETVEEQIQKLKAELKNM